MSMVNARSLQLQCARVLHESLLVLVVTYGSETLIWREKKSSAGYRVNGYCPKCTDKVVVQGDEG